MTPQIMKKQAEAERLIQLYSTLNLKSGSYQYTLSIKNAKKCAIICIDEIIKEYDDNETLGSREYWASVREIIEQS